jgi:hypothetical protein
LAAGISMLHADPPAPTTAQRTCKRMIASHKTSYLAAVHLPFILRMRVSSNPITRHDLLVTTNATSPFAGIWDCMHRVLLILSPPSADVHWDLLE